VIGNQKILTPNDEFTGGFSDLLSSLESKGFIISNSPFSEFLLALDHNEQGYREFLRCGGLLSNTFLIRLEPSAVLPFQYKKKILKKYARVLTPGGIKRLQINQIRFLQYPYRYSEAPLTPRITDPSYHEVLRDNINIGLFDIKKWEERPLHIAMVASNKVGANFKNNYGKRRKVAKLSADYGISVFGTKWDESLAKNFKYRLAIIKNSLLNYKAPNVVSVFSSFLSKYPHAKGEIPDRKEVLRSSKFTIVIENSNEAITEKIFDCMLFGSIPVYLGPNLSEFMIPQKAYIKLSGDIVSTIDALNRVSLWEAQEYLEEMKNFLSSIEFEKKYSASNVFGIISDEVEIYFNAERNKGN